MNTFGLVAIVFLFRNQAFAYGDTDTAMQIRCIHIKDVITKMSSTLLIQF